MSVRIAAPVLSLIAERTRSPSARPGPRNDWPDVRFALSNDALKMNGTFTRRVMSTRAAAIERACASLSMTHGPAMSASGPPPPIATLPTSTGFMAVDYMWAGRADCAITRQEGLDGRDRQDGEDTE